MKHIFLLLLISFGIFGCSQKPTTYKIVNKFSIPGDGYWDYLSVDSKGHLYVSHNTMVQVVDIKTRKVVATIDGLNHVHGIALAEKLNKGFISSGDDSIVAVFNLNTFKIITKVKVTGANPDAILYDPFTNKVFTFNGKSSNSTVIDANSYEIVTTIPLAGKPEFSVTDKKGRIYVNIEDKSMITCIDAYDLRVEKTWSLAPGEEPSGLAADFATGKLFSVCDNNYMIISDIKSGKAVDSLPIGSHPDGAAFDETLKRIYSSNGEGSLTVVDEDGNTCKVLNNFNTQKGARTICVDQNTHHIYLPTAEYEPLKEGQRRPDIKPGTFVVLEVAPE